jgi:Flp pilus assembly protein TadG
MIGRGQAFFAATRGALGKAAARLGREVRRLRRGRRGIVAVEFALILPMLLALYFGCVVLVQGLEVGRKTQALSRTLADLTSQTLPAASQTNPTLTDTDFVNFFSAWSAVLYPFVGSGSPNMTITQVVFDNVSSASTQCCVAKVMWSVGSGPSPTLRQCGTLAQSSNGVNAPGSIPAGLYPPQVATGNATDYFIIIADVSYTYVPSFGFAPFAWNQAPNGGAGYNISHTTYMAPRNGSTAQIVWTPGGTFSASQYASCSPNLP